LEIPSTGKEKKMALELKSECGKCGVMVAPSE
jgi:hypothetical protein